ncbi:MAG TPA: alpha/beta hydrolase [Steroidobacteraceae bacterium]|jgi:pimeloyl-ACP methyl ester carboxylesterase|nr:alpha/beta hydrolase [Steroidobacteraceae bacterium]
MSEDGATHILYVHGLWMNGTESLLLRRRLQKQLGFPVHAFHYRSVSASIADAIAGLEQFVRELAPARLHLVAHSLGGLVIYRWLEQFPEQPPGRVVFLGVPAVASRAALSAARREWALTPLGRCVAEELLCERSRRWTASRELGIIAGTHAVGLGRLFVKFDEESDGTVAVSETRLPGATDFITLPVSHTGLMLSSSVARETAAFLQTGRFTLRP